MDSRSDATGPRRVGFSGRSRETSWVRAGLGSSWQAGTNPRIFIKITPCGPIWLRSRDFIITNLASFAPIPKRILRVAIADRGRPPPGERRAQHALRCGLEIAWIWVRSRDFIITNLASFARNILANLGGSIHPSPHCQRDPAIGAARTAIADRDASMRKCTTSRVTRIDTDTIGSTRAARLSSRRGTGHARVPAHL